jgi:hypothetical protein
MTANSVVTPEGLVQVPEVLKVSVTMNDPVKGFDVATSSDCTVALVALVTVAVAVSLIVNSTHDADDEIADPPLVVVPLMLVQVALSSAVPIE